MKTSEEFEEMIRWRKMEFHKNGWNALDLKASEILKNAGDQDDEIETVAEGMKHNMLEGDVVLKGSFEDEDDDLIIRYYCDNLDENTRGRLF